MLEFKNSSEFPKGTLYHRLVDAYSVLLEIFNLSKNKIIIDNYAGKEILDELKTINKKVIIISSNINKNLKTFDITKQLSRCKNLLFV